jgi:hypothetical protein
LRNGRPYYRSIPARRPAGSSRVNKLDYYLYSTRVRGFDEWLLDTNDVDVDGAEAHASDANLLPYRVNSDWSVFHHARREWIAEPLRVTCLDDNIDSAAPRRLRGGGACGSAPQLGAVLGAFAALALARGRRPAHRAR